MSTAAQTRAAGFYWVRHRKWIICHGGWTVGEWCRSDDGGYWSVVGTDEGFGDGDMAEIDERPIQRQP
ncbi:hypothetical protein TSH7_01150 [Azospirillum sp. TSH7]|nr:hypothetical protein TSH7_01150 [Azospirillum sp. TSH7]PWC71425.1 hypothetical protein TSH20_03925 [Azospirillum sp. TSH20]